MPFFKYEPGFFDRFIYKGNKPELLMLEIYKFISTFGSIAQKQGTTCKSLMPTLACFLTFIHEIDPYFLLKFFILL